MAAVRPVHYVAHGAGGLAFGCYVARMREHLDSPQIVIGNPDRIYQRKVHRIPEPRRHTDLNKVTCLECWKHIRWMAQQHLRG